MVEEYFIASKRSLSRSQIPDFRNNTHEVFLALDKRGDFRIWQDEFEGLCDVIAIEIERKSRKHRMPRSRVAELSRVITETRLISEPVHDLIFWILTLASVLVAFFGSQVHWCDLPLIICFVFISFWAASSFCITLLVSLYREVETC